MTIHVIGNVTEDLIFRLDRLPDPGETLIAAARQSDIGGKGLNQALICARAGVPTRLTAPVGRDEAGRRAARIAEEEAIVADFPALGPDTDQSIIWVDAQGENVIVSTAAAAAALDPGAAAAALAQAAPGDTLLMQGNLTRETTEAALSAARKAGVRTVVNAAPIQWSYGGLWERIDLLIVNREEARSLGGEDDATTAAAGLMGRGVGAVLLTLGRDGAVLLEPGGTVTVPAEKVEAVDTAGAGDTFTAVYLAARQRGFSDRNAMTAAARAAALTVARRGTFSAFPTASELADILGRTG